MNKNPIVIHFFYVVLILTLLIVAIIVWKYGTNMELVNYVSFAATISSILLAIAAIIYSYYSNNTFSQNVGELNNASNKITKTSQGLIEIVNKLDKKIDQIPDHFKGVEEKTDQLLQAVNKSILEPSKKNEDLKPADALVPVALVESFLQKTSFLSMKLIYASKLSIESAKPFKREVVLGVYMNENSKSYIDGFLVALSSMGLLKYKVTAELIHISYINNDLSEKIHDRVYQYAENEDKDQTDTEFLWTPQLRNLENFFT